MMRTLILMCLLVAASLLLTPALAEPMNYLSDFSAGTDGWYPRSMGDAALAVTEEGTLMITGRGDNWHSPGRDFALGTGKTYELQVQVRQHQADEARFMISVAHTKNGIESYENLAAGVAKKGQWATLSGKYTAGVYEQFVLYVETSNAGTVDFEIRNFQVKEEVPLSFDMETLPKLKDVYAGQFDFGTAVTYRESIDTQRMDFYASQFNIITPGNELKPDSVLDVSGSIRLAREDETAVAVKFDAVKPLLDYAKAHGIKVHGHVLVWHQQTPEGFFHEGYKASKPLVTREVLLARLDNYVAAIMTWLEKNYPGVVVSWDVVNEAIDDGNGKLRDSKWLTIVGEDYVARAFEIARKHAPEGTLLFYNDYNTAVLIKQMGILTLLNDLKAEGNIDGYGFQMHHDVDSPNTLDIMTALKRLGDTGLKLRVSELDVTIPDNSVESLENQAKKYSQIMKLLEPYAGQLISVQVWGTTDNLSWRAPQYPLLFDAKAQPKPAFWAVVGQEAPAGKE